MELRREAIARGHSYLHTNDSCKLRAQQLACHGVVRTNLTRRRTACCTPRHTPILPTSSACNCLLVSGILQRSITKPFGIQRYLTESAHSACPGIKPLLQICWQTVDTSIQSSLLIAGLFPATGAPGLWLTHRCRKSMETWTASACALLRRASLARCTWRDALPNAHWQFYLTI